MPIGYHLGSALRAMSRSWLVQLAAVGSMAVTLLLVGVALLGSYNIDRLTQQWGRGLQLLVYTRPDASPPAVAALERLLRRRPEVAAVRHIGSREAFARLKASLGQRSALLDSVEEDFLPTSLEVRLHSRPDATTLPLLALLRASNAVDRVDHLGQWADRLGRLAALARTGAFVVALGIVLACIYLAASTVRLGVYARREELEIQKLLGATKSFIRLPLLVEGAIQGLCGAIVALTALYALYRWSAPGLSAGLRAALGPVELSFLRPIHITAALTLGLLIGLAGSGLALGRSVEG